MTAIPYTDSNLLIDIKNDAGACQHFLSFEGTYKFENEVQRENIRRRALRDDDTCICNPEMSGARWSDIMSMQECDIIPIDHWLLERLM